MSFVGQAPSTKPMIATLTTTKSGAMDDEKGNPIKGGLFLIEGTTHGIMIAETLLFRPLYSNYQYRKFDPDNNDNNCDNEEGNCTTHDCVSSSMLFLMCR